MLANKTPLTELLRTIPIEQRLVFEPDKFHSTNWPIGAMCHEAADRIKELEAQGAVDRATCRWCGTIHARKMNILCPLTIAEAKLAAVKEQALYFCAEFENDWKEGRVSIDTRNAQIALAKTLAIGEQE